jgi:hypothetical protein
MVHHSTVRVSTLSIVENGNQGDGVYDNNKNVFEVGVTLRR